MEPDGGRRLELLFLESGGSFFNVPRSQKSQSGYVRACQEKSRSKALYGAEPVRGGTAVRSLLLRRLKSFLISNPIAPEAGQNRGRDHDACSVKRNCDSCANSVMISSRCQTLLSQVS